MVNLALAEFTTTDGGILEFFNLTLLKIKSTNTLFICLEDHMSLTLTMLLDKDLLFKHLDFQSDGMDKILDLLLLETMISIILRQLFNQEQTTSSD